MADCKIMHSNKAFLIEAVGATGVVESQGMDFRTEQIGCTFYVLSDKAGSLQLQVYINNPTSEVLEEAGWKNMGAPRAIVANTLDVSTLNQGMMPCRVQFTPTASPHTTKVIAWGFGG